MNACAMNRNLPLIIVSLLCIILIVSGCNPGKRALVKGFNSYSSGDYDVAIGHYQQAVDHGVEAGVANYQIAESYRLSNRIDEALPFYQAAIESGIEDTVIHLHYAYALKANGEYEKAKEELKEYLAPRDTILPYTALAKTELQNLENLGKILSKDVYFEVEPVAHVNSEGAEYAPLVFNGKFYFTSSRGNDNIYKATGTPFTNIYQAPISEGKIEIEKASTLGEDFTISEVNEGIVAFSPDGKTMVFARGNDGKRKGTKDVNLYISRLIRGEWNEPQLMTINDPDSWTSTPAFSGNGRTLYFASNRPGGNGGTDLYSARLDNYGRWGGVQNMGPEINTPGNEMFPYISDDGKMYFSSTGHPGMGGLDIFVATRKDGVINIENLGPPVNSTADDFGICFTSIKDGYFTSNRESGTGDDDIYAFVNNDPNLKVVNYFLAGKTTTTNDDGEEEILQRVSVKLTSPSGSVIASDVTGMDGAFKFEVEGGTNYELIGEKEGHFTTRLPFTTVGKTIPQEQLVEMVTDTTFYQDLLLENIFVGKTIVLENIYYDYDEHFIRDDAAVELDKLVAVLRDNPQISIELSSHTDARASNEYNQKLSQRRAEAAVTYLIESGIDPARITAKGYGEEKLILMNAMTEEEHQVNRRTEFQVTKIDQRTNL